MTAENPRLEHSSPRKKSLWRRWMDWSGSFFILSLLFHILLIVLATLLIVQVIGSKPKLKFVAAPPIAAHPEEYHVKHSKKMASDAPAISKRITSTALNAQITLPSVDISTSTAPDVMDSVMSGLAASGLGAGAGSGGGIASMPMEGLTAFGFRGAGGHALVGHFYDLKQTPERKPTEILDGVPGIEGESKVMTQFFNGGWDENFLSRFYKAKDSLNAYQIWVPRLPAPEGPKAFGVQKEVPLGSHWLVLYKGTVVAPKDGEFRFLGYGDDMIAVRFDGETVFGMELNGDLAQKYFGGIFKNPKEDKVGLSHGLWFHVERGKSYPIEVVIGEEPGGDSEFILMIEDRNPDKPYPHRTFPGFENCVAYPVFQVRKGPIPPYVRPPRINPNSITPDEIAPETAPNPVIFPAR